VRGFTVAGGAPAGLFITVSISFLLLALNAALLLPEGEGARWIAPLNAHRNG
jgi:hypothetical protein